MTRVLPVLHGYPIKKKPTWSTLVRTPKSGREVTRFQQPTPLWEFELTYEELREQTQNQSVYKDLIGFTELEQISSVFISTAAQAGYFLFDDLSDDSRTGQLIGVGDGTAVSFRFQRTISFGSLSFTEFVGEVNQSKTINIYLNGVLTPSAGNWSISTDNTTITFTSPPANGVLVTSDFYYYYLCRFITDSQEFEEFLYNRWLVKSLKFRSVYRPNVPSVEAVSFLSQVRGSFFDASSGSGTNLGTFNTEGFTNFIIMAILSITNDTRGINPTISSVVTSTQTLNHIGSANIDIPGEVAICNLELWGVAPTGPMSDETPAITFTGGAPNNIVWIAGMFNGINQVDPFDSDPSLPMMVTAPTIAGPSATISTANANDVIFWAAGGQSAGANAGMPTGFTAMGTEIVEARGGLGNIAAMSVGYLITTTPQSSRLLAPPFPAPGCSGTTAIVNYTP